MIPKPVFMRLSHSPFFLMNQTFSAYLFLMKGNITHQKPVNLDLVTGFFSNKVINMGTSSYKLYGSHVTSALLKRCICGQSYAQIKRIDVITSYCPSASISLFSRVTVLRRGVSSHTYAQPKLLELCNY